MDNKRIFGTLYYQISDTTDVDAQAKIHGAVVKAMSGFGLAPNFHFLPAETSVLVGTRASELATNTVRPPCQILALNFAPPDRKEGTDNNARNDFFCADLGPGMVACGTNNGFEFSYLKPLIRAFYRLTNTNHLGSQFRSLEVLPEHAVRFALPDARAHMLAADLLEPVTDIATAIRPVPDVTHVLQVDNFGNVKLVPSHADAALLRRAAEERAEILFSFGAASFESTRRRHHTGPSLTYTAQAAPTLFAAPLGTNVIGARSSSFLCDGRDVPIIATIRLNPASTRPAFAPSLPTPGTPVKLALANPGF